MPEVPTPTHPEPDYGDEREPYSWDAPQIGMFLGHIHSLTETPAEEKKRRPGFVTQDDYVRRGIVKQYKSKRKR